MAGTIPAGGLPHLSSTAAKGRGGLGWHLCSFKVGTSRGLVQSREEKAGRLSPHCNRYPKGSSKPVPCGPCLPVPCILQRSGSARDWPNAPRQLETPRKSRHPRRPAPVLARASTKGGLASLLRCAALQCTVLECHPTCVSRSRRVTTAPRVCAPSAVCLALITKTAWRLDGPWRWIP